VEVSLQHLRIFVAVADERSFSRAADKLFTSQPHVSNQVRKLEEQFGTQLFVRSSTAVEMTEGGEVLYRHATQILGELRQMQTEMRQFTDLTRGSLVVASCAAAGHGLLPAVLARFLETSGSIKVDLRVGNSERVLDMLAQHIAEIGLCTRPSERTRLESKPLYIEPLVLVAAAAAPAPQQVDRDWLRANRMVLREPGSATRERTLALVGETYAPEPVVTEGTTAVNEAVARGLGWSLVPARAAAAWLDDGRLRRLETALELPSHEYYVISGSGTTHSPAAKSFLALVVEIAGAAGAAGARAPLS
jgi:DNA-binding transcriptional LysR family regulator